MNILAYILIVVLSLSNFFWILACVKYRREKDKAYFLIGEMSAQVELIIGKLKK